MSNPSSTPTDRFRIGVDLGGTKIEFVALERDGRELHRHRVPTPRNDYDGTIRAIKEGVELIERDLHRGATVGVGIPGTISRTTNAVKIANSTWMNGRPFDRDLGAALQREVRCANDANCLAVSEATDGSGAGKHVVFAVVLGTGCGGGIALDEELAVVQDRNIGVESGCAAPGARRARASGKARGACDRQQRLQERSETTKSGQ